MVFYLRYVDNNISRASDFDQSHHWNNNTGKYVMIKKKRWQNTILLKTNVLWSSPGNNQSMTKRLVNLPNLKIYTRAWLCIIIRDSPISKLSYHANSSIIFYTQTTPKFTDLTNSLHIYYTHTSDKSLNIFTRINIISQSLLVGNTSFGYKTC